MKQWLQRTTSSAIELRDLNEKPENDLFIRYKRKERRHNQFSHPHRKVQQNHRNFGPDES